MKLAIFTDLHLGIKSDDHKWHDVAFKWADSMIERLEKDGINTIVFLGDFFHNRSTISVDTLNATSKFLDKFRNFNLHMILGNHDLYYDKIYDVSAVNIFNGYPNIKVYTKPTHVKFGSRDCLMCGWGYNPLEYSADVLFTHAEISSFKLNRKSPPCDMGLKCSELLPNYKLIYSGHFHLRQSKEYNNGSVRFVGNPFQMDFSDERSEKGFDILDTETLEYEFVENTTSPKFVRYYLSKLMEIRDFDVLKEEIKNNYFKLYLDRNITLSDVNDLMTLINNCEPRHASSEWENGQSFSENIDDDDFVIDDFDMRSVIRKFIEMSDFPDKKFLTGYLLEKHTIVTNK